MPIKDPEKRRDYNRAYARKRRAGLTRLTSQTLSANVHVSPQHVETLLDLHEVMAQAIDMLRNDHESTPSLEHEHSRTAAASTPGSLKWQRSASCSNRSRAKSKKGS